MDINLNAFGPAKKFSDGAPYEKRQPCIVMRVPEDPHTRIIKRIPEGVAAVALFFFGADTSPGNSFQLSHVYDVLGQIASEKQWAFVALSIATTRLVALILNGFFPYVRRVTPVLRSLTAFGSGCVWLALAIGLAMFDGHVPGIAAHLGFALLDFVYAAVVAHEAAASLRFAFNAQR